MSEAVKSGALDLQAASWSITPATEKRGKGEGNWVVSAFLQEVVWGAGFRKRGAVFMAVGRERCGLEGMLE